MARAEVVDSTELVTCDGVSKQQGAHSEPYPVMVPACVEPACPGTLRYGSMKHMGRVPRIHPVKDLVVGYRFRDKFCTALATAAAVLFPGPGRDPGSDLLDVQDGIEAMISPKQDRQFFPRTGRVTPPDPSPWYPWESPGPANTSDRHSVGSRVSRSIHSVFPLAQTRCASLQEKETAVDLLIGVLLVRWDLLVWMGSEN